MNRIIIKSVIKYVLTFVSHPVASLHFFKEGSRKIYIGSQFNAKGLKHIHIGSNTSIYRDCRILCVSNYCGCAYNPKVSIGKNNYIGFHFTIMAAAPVTIGNNALIASNVVITSENHGMNPELSLSYADTPLEVAEVKIGDGCWIGEKVTILPGVTLGDRCIVAAGAIVTKSFPSYSLVGGVPARLLKTYNFEIHRWEKA